MDQSDGPYLSDNLYVSVGGYLYYKELNPFNSRRWAVYEVLGIKDDMGWVLRLIAQ